MKIGIIGSGHIGGTAARLFTEAGHDVAVSNARGPETLRELVRELGDRAKAVTVDEAAQFGEVVLVATPYKTFRELKSEAFSGKVVIDAANYYPQRDGHVAEVDSGAKSSSEVFAAHFPGAKVVKAFNTMYYQHLSSYGDKQAPTGERYALFLAGDDSEAKKKVAGLIQDIGFAAIDTGSLHEGGLQQQPGSPIYNKPMKGKEAEAALKGKKGVSA